DFSAFREQLISAARQKTPAGVDVAPRVEAQVTLTDLTPGGWNQLPRLGPFRPGNPWPVLQISGVEKIRVRSRTAPSVATKPLNAVLRAGDVELPAELEPAAVRALTLETPLESSGPGDGIGYAKAGPK